MTAARAQRRACPGPVSAPLSWPVVVHGAQLSRLVKSDGLSCRHAR
jgi:hypothetical protein